VFLFFFFCGCVCEKVTNVLVKGVVSYTYRHAWKYIFLFHLNTFSVLFVVSPFFVFFFSPLCVCVCVLGGLRACHHSATGKWTKCFIEDHHHHWYSACTCATRCSAGSVLLHSVEVWTGWSQCRNHVNVLSCFENEEKKKKKSSKR
jgi:hypothetical protein